MAQPRKKHRKAKSSRAKTTRSHAASKKHAHVSSKKTAHKKTQSVSTYRNLKSAAGVGGKKKTRSQKKAEYLATLPKSRIKRFFYRLHPKRFFSYWFSKKGLIMAFKLSLAGLILSGILLGGIFLYFTRDLPDPRDYSAQQLNQTTKFYDRTGEYKLFEIFGDQNRTLVEFDEISDAMKHATVAVEDKDFYEHGGFSFRGTLRALVNNLTSSGGTQGGSTITQQFIKNSLLSNEQKISRKIKELILSLEFERLYTKDEILSFYLNEIPFGSLEYGIEAASQSFFQKNALDLTIDEAALLAALPQAPSYYSPYGDNLEDLIIRQQVIINLMEEQGYITGEEAINAKQIDVLAKLTPIEERSLYADIEAPHFVLAVQEQLEAEYTATFVRNSGLKVITTLDYDLQKVAEKAVEDNIATVVNPVGGGGGDNAALVSTDVETGHVVAMVGSRDFRYPEYGSFNAALANRQPGSSIKPFGYAELFSEGDGPNDNRWGPDSYIYDTKTEFGEYAPKNYDSSFKGRVRVREALGQSRNIPAVKALYLAGLENTVDLAKRMGNSSLGDPAQYGLSFILGSAEVKLAEHTHAYSTFARDGKFKEQEYILRVENTDGDILDEWQDTEGVQVLDEQVAYLISDALSDDSARAGVFGRNNQYLVVPGLTHTVKTGTTDSDKDGWMMGYTRYLSTGIWVGNHDNTAMNSATSKQTGPIFTQFMKEAHEVKNYEDVSIHENEPEGIKTVRLNTATGFATSSDDEDVSVRYAKVPSWYEPEYSSNSDTYQIDSISKKAVTDCTPERAIEDVKSGANWPEIARTDQWYGVWARTAWYGGGSGAPSEEDDVHSCDDAKPNVAIQAQDQSNGAYKLIATVSQGTHSLKTLNFIVDDQVVSSIALSGNGTHEYTHVFTEPGDYTVKAEVIDEVLYDNTASQSINIQTAYSGGDVLGLSRTVQNASTNDFAFEWNSLSDATSYRVCWQPSGGETSCATTSGQGSSYSPSDDIDEATSYSAFVEAYLGNSLLQKSSSITFSTP